MAEGELNFENELLQDGPTSIETAQEAPSSAPDTAQTDSSTVSPSDEAPKGPQKPKPPGRMPAEARKAFDGLDPDAQETVATAFKEMQGRYTKVNQELRGYKQKFDGIEQLLAPRRQAFAMQGMDDTRVVSQLLALSDYAEKSPLEFIKWFAQQRGLKLDQLTQSQTPEYIDPELQKRDQKIAQLEQALQGQQGKWQSLEQQTQDARKSALLQQIESFRNRTDQSGRPLYPFFDELDEDMAILFESGRAKTLEDAYDMAVYANPSTRQRILSAQQAETQRKAAEDMRLRAEKSRRAGSSVSGYGSGSMQRPPANGSVADTMSEAWDLALHGAS